MASNKMTTNAWSGPLAAAVGALYKDYATRPTAADALKAQLMQEQLQTAPVEREKLQLGNQSAQRLYDMGGWDGAPAIVQEKLFGDTLPAQDRGRYEDIYVTKPSWQDFGDQKILMGVNGPINARTVGAPPRTDVKDGRVFNIPAMQSQPVNLFPSRKPIPQQGMPQLFPSEMGQSAQGMGANEITNAAAMMSQPVSMEELNAPVNTGRPSTPSMMPSQEGMNGGYGQPSAGISLPFASTDPQVNGGVQVTDLPPSAADVAKKGETDRVRNIQVDIVNDDVRRALDLSEKSGGVPTTGLLGGAASFVPGTDAYNMKEILDTLEANTAFDRLESMRLRSPTGAALGSVQVRELELLGKVLGSLKQSATKEQFQYNLMRFHNAYNDLIHDAGNGPRYDLGMTESGGNALNPDVQSLLDKYAP